MALANQHQVMPSGAAIAGAYGPGIAPASTGPFGASHVAANVTRVAGPEYKPDLVIDESHCHWVNDADGVRTQCKSWPVRKEDVANPKHYCAGHLKKATNGANPPADQGLRQGAS